MAEHEVEKVRLPEGDCSCTWSTDGTHQTAICPGHKALALLACCKAGEGCTSSTCSGTPEPTACSNCESGCGDFVCSDCEDGAISAKPSDYRPWLLNRIDTAAEQHDRDVAEGRIVEVAPGRFQMTGGGTDA